MGERFELYKARHNPALAEDDDGCLIAAVLSRFNVAVHAAMKEIEESPTCDKDWKRIYKNADALLEHLPKVKSGAEALLTVWTLLEIFDEVAHDPSG